MHALSPTSTPENHRVNLPESRDAHVQKYIVLIRFDGGFAENAEDLSTSPQPLSQTPSLVYTPTPLPHPSTQSSPSITLSAGKGTFLLSRRRGRRCSKGLACACWKGGRRRGWCGMRCTFSFLVGCSLGGAVGRWGLLGLVCQLRIFLGGRGDSDSSSNTCKIVRKTGGVNISPTDRSYNTLLSNKRPL